MTYLKFDAIFELLGQFSIYAINLIFFKQMLIVFEIKYKTWVFFLVGAVHLNLSVHYPYTKTKTLDECN